MWWIIAAIANLKRRGLKGKRRFPYVEIRGLRAGDIVIPGTVGERIYHNQPIEYERLESFIEGDDVLECDRQAR